MMLLRILAHLLKRVLSHDVDGRRRECRIVMYAGGCCELTHEGRWAGTLVVSWKGETPACPT